MLTLERIRMAVTGIQALRLVHQTRCEECEASSPGYLILLRVERRLSQSLSQLIRSNAELSEEVRTAFESNTEWNWRATAIEMESLLRVPGPTDDRCPECVLLEDEVRRARLEYERLVEQQDSYSAEGAPASRHFQLRIKQAAAKRWSALSRLDAHMVSHDP